MKRDCIDRIALEPRKLIPYPWRLWRSWRGQRTIAGDYATRRDADRGLRQLQKLYGDRSLTIEYIGRPIGHADIGGRSL